MEYTIERFGKYTHTLRAGLSIIVPFVDRVGYRVNMRERKLAIRLNDLKTKDNMEVISAADIYVTVTDAAKVAYEASEIDEIVRLRCELEMKKLIKSLELSEVLSNADKIDGLLLGALQQHEAVWGMDIRYIDVHRIHPV